MENWFTDHSNIPANIFRYELTGITEAHLRDAMPLKEVREKLWKFYEMENPLGDCVWMVGRADFLWVMTYAMTWIA